MIARIQDWIKRRRIERACKRLAATMRPDMAYWHRRLSHLSPERRARQLMSAGVLSPELWG